MFNTVSMIAMDQRTILFSRLFLYFPMTFLDEVK